MIRKLDLSWRQYFHYTKWLYLVILLFYLGGLILGLSYQNDPSFRQVDSDLHFGERQEHALAYFIHNIKLAFLTILGVFSFGLIPIIICFMNGVILGGAIIGTLEKTNSLNNTLFMLFPHGLFEIPALLTCFVLGLFLLKKACIILKNRGEKWISKTDIHQFIFGVVLVISFLLIASILEFYFSPEISS